MNVILGVLITRRTYNNEESWIEGFQFVIEEENTGLQRGIFFLG